MSQRRTGIRGIPQSKGEAVATSTTTFEIARVNSVDQIAKERQR